MLDKFGLAWSTGGKRDAKIVCPVITAEGRIFVLVELHHGSLNFQDDKGMFIVPKRSEFAGMILKVFPFAGVVVERQEVQVGIRLRGDKNEFVRIVVVMNFDVVFIFLFF